MQQVEGSIWFWSSWSFRLRYAGQEWLRADGADLIETHTFYATRPSIMPLSKLDREDKHPLLSR